MPVDVYNGDFNLLSQLHNFKKYNEIHKAEKHDIIVFNFYRTQNPPHLAIYLGNGFILHHPKDGFSQIVSLSEIYQKKYLCHLRLSND